jgi:hypothetical protein
LLACLLSLNQIFDCAAVLGFECSAGRVSFDFSSDARRTFVTLLDYLLSIRQFTLRDVTMGSANPKSPITFLYFSLTATTPLREKKMPKNSEIFLHLFGCTAGYTI